MICPKEMRAQLAQVFKHTEHLSIVDVRTKWNNYFNNKIHNESK